MLEGKRLNPVADTFGHCFKKIIFGIIRWWGLRYASAPMTSDRPLRANLKEEEGQERQEVEKEKGEDWDSIVRHLSRNGMKRSALKHP